MRKLEMTPWASPRPTEAPWAVSFFLREMEREREIYIFKYSLLMTLVQ